MSDPFTLATVSATVLPQLVKFVFEQAGKVMDKHRSAAKADNAATTGDQQSSALAELEQSTQVLRKYTVDGAQPHTTDQELLNALGSAWRRIESLTGQRLDVATGLKQRGVHLEFTNDDIDGTVTAIKATAITDKANVSIRFNDSVVRPGGEYTAIEIDGPIG
ncbi:hypothetical protein OG738_22030 [Amycolatopsis sp. NBC_01488]|uniref:hypothetical protein n=1 Tax=Amycolatopsis sp. NBC_01488 TaxID=2903563 RepID=UPI002E2C0C22|nr:hypothetical protein [Amycolatopsis sp. NBC_01488]